MYGRETSYTVYCSWNAKVDDADEQDLWGAGSYNIFASPAPVLLLRRGLVAGKPRVREEVGGAAHKAELAVDILTDKGISVNHCMFYRDKAVRCCISLLLLC